MSGPIALKPEDRPPPDLSGLLTDEELKGVLLAFAVGRAFERPSDPTFTAGEATKVASYANFIKAMGTLFGMAVRGEVLLGLNDDGDVWFSRADHPRWGDR